MLLMEQPPEAADGSNRTFTTSVPYLAGSVRAWAPHLQPDGDVTEVDSTTVQLAEAPLQGVVVYLSYREA